MHRKLLTILFCNLVLLSFTSAQSEAEKRPKLAASVESNNLTNIHWSLDGQTLLFIDQTVFFTFITGQTGNQPAPKFYSLGVTLSKLALQSISPEDFQKTEIGTIAVSQLKLAAENSVPSQAVLSPDGRFLVYPTSDTPSGTYGNFVALTDSLSNKTVIVPDIIVDLGFRIAWSGDGSAFTLRRQNGFAADNTYYVSGYDKNLNAVKTTQLDALEVEGELVGVRTDFSALTKNGKTVLLAGQIGVKELNLFLWDVDNPKLNRKLVISSHTFTSATFSSDKQSVIFINPDGLQRVDLKTLKVTVIDATINSTWVSQAFFRRTRRR